MRIKKRNKKDERYLPLDDIKKIDDEFLTEMENVKRRLGYVKDPEIIKTFQKVLLDAYNAAIEVKTLDREVDYEIKFAEIKARRNNIKPWRRCWLWRLLFQPLTNRAQDIIEERAALNANIEHTTAENEIENDRKQLPPAAEKTPSKHKLKRIMRDKLKQVIETADSADTGEALEEPKPAAADVEPVQEPPQTQLSLDGLPQPGTRRPRPPRSCRKPRT